MPHTFSIAELIAWGYETGGDFDEACRVYHEIGGVDLFMDLEQFKEAKKAFYHNFNITDDQDDHKPAWLTNIN